MPSTTVDSRGALGIEDYREKSYIPIEYMKNITVLMK